MPELSDLIAKRAALDKQIAQAQREQRSAAITQIRQLMAEHELSAADIAGRRGNKKSGNGGSGAKVPAKYRNKATGETWSGRGLQPRWLKAALASGKKLADFAV